MISLTDLQADALTELINISFGLTAAKLSEISGHRILLDAAAISIRPIEDLFKGLRELVKGDVATVHQVFSGPVSGDAILLLNYEGAVSLSNLLVAKHLQSPHLDVVTGEVLTEVGNMLLSACLGMFSNLLQVHVTFSIPRLHMDTLEDFVTSISVRGNELRYAIVITTKFSSHDKGIVGEIAIVLGVSSLERLLQAVEEYEGRQGSTA